MRQPISAYTDSFDQHMLNTSVEDELAAVIKELIGERVAPDACLIDFCCRSGYMLTSLAKVLPHRKAIGVDKNQNRLEGDLPALARRIAGDPSNRSDNESHTPKNYAPKGKPERLLLNANVFTPIELDTKLNDLAGNTQRVIFCRPPAGTPMLHFVDHDDAVIAERRAFGTQSEFYATEFFYGCACLQEMGPDSIAVLQVSSRLLNFAKCITDRQKFIEAGVISSVALLPESLSQQAGSDTDALIVLDRNADQTIEFFDARYLGSSAPKTGIPQYEHDALETAHLIHSGRQAIKHGTAPSNHCRVEGVDQLAHNSWSLLPFGVIVDWGDLPQRAIGELFTVTRGTPRSVITKLPTAKEAVTRSKQGGHAPTDGEYAPAYYYCLNIGVIEDGETICFDDLIRRIDKKDAYDLGDLRKLEFEGLCTGLLALRTLDARYSHVVVSRFGYPFKVSQINPMEYGHDWTEDSMVLPDSMLAITPIGHTARDMPTCLPEYLLALLSSNEGQELLNTAARGARVRQLSVGDVRNMRIPVPSIEKQRMYAEQFMTKQRSFEKAREAYAKAREEKRHLYF